MTYKQKECLSFVASYLTLMFLIIPALGWLFSGHQDINPNADQVDGFFLLVAALAIYVIPAEIGYKRGVTNKGVLLAINLLAGWTLVGWVVCMIWAVAGATQAQDDFYRQRLTSHQ